MTVISIQDEDGFVDRHFRKAGKILRGLLRGSLTFLPKRGKAGIIRDNIWEKGSAALC